MGGVDISMSTLRRHLRPLGLLRRKTQSDLLEVSVFLQEKLNQYGMLHLCMTDSVDGFVCVWSFGFMLIQRLSITPKVQYYGFAQRWSHVSQSKDEEHQLQNSLSSSSKHPFKYRLSICSIKLTICLHVWGRFRTLRRTSGTLLKLRQLWDSICSRCPKA